MNQSHIDAINEEAKRYNDVLLKVFAALAKYGTFEQTGEKIPEDQFCEELYSIFGESEAEYESGTVYVYSTGAFGSDCIHIKCFQSPNLDKIKSRYPLQKADWTVETLSAFIKRYEDANKLANKMRAQVKSHEMMIFTVDRLAQDSIKTP